jgi:hypothetical protein
MSSRDFRDLCKGSLRAADMALLDLCTLDPDEPPQAGTGDAGVQAGAPPSGGPSYAEAPKPVASDFINKWRNWERSLRLNLARYRAQRLKREGGAAADPPDYPADAAAAAKAAAAMDSPLEAEIFLDKARWDAIELFQGIDYFSRNTIFAYLLKLRLLERRALFKAEEGFSEYKGLYTSIIEDSEDASKSADRLRSDESGVPK